MSTTQASNRNLTGGVAMTASLTLKHSTKGSKSGTNKAYYGREVNSFNRFNKITSTVHSNRASRRARRAR
jgi:hypothetical protein